MNLGTTARRTLAGALLLATSSVAFQAAAEENTITIPDYLNDVVSPAADNCIRQGRAVADTDDTRHLLELFTMAQQESAAAERIIQGVNRIGYTMCYVDDPQNIGTNRVRMLSDDQGPYHEFFGTISSNDSAYPENLTEEERDALKAFGMLEEFAHGMNSAYLLLNAQMETNSFAALLSLTDLIEKMWADEAMASTTAVVAARQQLENGEPALWSALQKFPIYHQIIAAVDNAAQEDIDFLTNGEAHVRGFAAWYDTPELCGRMFEKVIPLYQQQLAHFKAMNLPVAVQQFGPQNILQMAAAQGHYDAYAARIGLVQSVTSPMMFAGLPPQLTNEIRMIEADASAHRAAMAQRELQPALTQ